MRRCAFRLVLLDGKIVLAEHFHAVIDEKPRAALADADEVRVELGGSPQARIVCLEEQADVFGEVEASQGPRP